jgi:hypothetical protein
MTVAERPTVRVWLPLDELKVCPGIQQRVSIRNNVVEDYARDLEAGDTFPPVVCFDDGEARWLADGHYRLMAHRAAGKDKIRCEVRDGSKEDAILYACGA